MNETWIINVNQSVNQKLNSEWNVEIQKSEWKLYIKWKMENERKLNI